MAKREPKESRSDWVAVEVQFQAPGAGSNQPAKPKSAFAFFQKRVMADVRSELATRAAEANEPLEVGAVMKETSARWQQLSAVEREEFAELAAADRRRYDDECRVRDDEVEAERKRKREELHADVDGKRERKRVSACCRHSLSLYGRGSLDADVSTVGIHDTLEPSGRRAESEARAPRADRKAAGGQATPGRDPAARA